MDWNLFVARVRDELTCGTRYFDFKQACADEHALTKTVAVGLRTLFKECHPGATGLADHVVYRQGDAPEDGPAWTASRPFKWVTIYGLNFVPDVLIRRSLDDATCILPVEIKLLKDSGRSQALATGIGQSLIYTVKYRPTILFVGVTMRKPSRRRTDTDFEPRTPDEMALVERLKASDVSVVFRHVGG